MDENPSEETAVVATYSTRHDAEIAKSVLEDNGISAFVVADDVHVPLQLTDGVRLIVMQSQVQRASEALNDLGLTADALAADEENRPEAAKPLHPSAKPIHPPAKPINRPAEPVNPADEAINRPAEAINRPAEHLTDPDSVFPDQENGSDDEEAGVNSSPPPSSDERGRSLQPRKRAIVASTIAALIVVVLFFVPWRVEPDNEIVWAPFYRSPITHTTTFEDPGVARMTYEDGEVAFGILFLQVLGVLAVGGMSFVLIPDASS